MQPSVISHLIKTKQNKTNHRKDHLCDLIYMKPEFELSLTMVLYLLHGQTDHQYVHYGLLSLADRNFSIDNDQHREKQAAAIIWLWSFCLTASVCL